MSCTSILWHYRKLQFFNRPSAAIPVDGSPAKLVVLALESKQICLIDRNTGQFPSCLHAFVGSDTIKTTGPIQDMLLKCWQRWRRTSPRITSTMPSVTAREGSGLELGTTPLCLTRYIMMEACTVMTMVSGSSRHIHLDLLAPYPLHALAIYVCQMS